MDKTCLSLNGGYPETVFYFCKVVAVWGGTSNSGLTIIIGGSAAADEALLCHFQILTTRNKNEK